MRATFKENLHLALGTVASHKLRSVLTIVGVVIGTTCVIAIGSILTGMDRNVIAMIEQFGTNTIFVSQWDAGISIGPRSREQRLRKPLSYANYETVVESCDACRYVGLQIWASNAVSNARYKNDRVDAVPLAGVIPAYADAMNMELDQGRFFTESENQSRADVCVIGSDIAKTFFGARNCVGQEISINGHALRVVGVYAQFKSMTGEATSNDKLIHVPYETYLKMRPGARDNFMVVQAHAGRLAEAVDQVREAMRRSRRVAYNAPDNFGMATSNQIQEQFHQITGAVALVMVIISSIGLLVGGVGVMNIMLVSVTERTREIGLRKAIGARRVDIILQFLLEACTLTGAGGLLGIALGTLISVLIRVVVRTLPSVVPLWAIAIGFIVSVSVGVFFGMWPAVKAARLDPVEALRYE